MKKDEKKYSAKNFVDLIEKLSKDKEKNVRYKIIEKIGEIIAPLDQDELSLELFEFYKNSCKKYYETKKSQHPLGATIQEEGNSLINKIKISSYTGGGNYAYLNDEESNDYNEVNNMEKNEIVTDYINIKSSDKKDNIINNKNNTAINKEFINVEIQEYNDAKDNRIILKVEQIDSFNIINNANDNIIIEEIESFNIINNANDDIIIEEIEYLLKIMNNFH